MKLTKITPEFVKAMPSKLVPGILYISQPYKVAVHLCCCGCGTKLVTSLASTEHSLSVDDGKVSLNESVGAWNHPCRSHYWIRDNEVHWTGDVPAKVVNRNRKRDAVRKKVHFGKSAVVKTRPWIERAWERVTHFLNGD